MYDPRFNIDGKNMPVVIPPAFGLRHVAKEIYTGDGPVSYWNAYVAITQMHGHGPFSDPRIGVNVNNAPDHSDVQAAAASRVSVQPERAGARRGHIRSRRRRSAATRCSRAPHAARAATSPARGATSTRASCTTPAEVGQSAAYADRSATKKYRTTPLRGLWHAPQLKGPYFHDGSAKTLEAAVDHEATLSKVTLTPAQKHDLVEYLKTL